MCGLNKLNLSYIRKGYFTLQQDALSASDFRLLKILPFSII